MPVSEKVALISGVSGQDGTYLAEFLLELGYIVHGVVHGSIQPRHLEVLPRHPSFHIHSGNIEDYERILHLVRTIEPDEVYNLAAQASVALSFKEPLRTAQATGMGAVHVLEAVRVCNLIHKTRVFQACSSEMFGKNTVPLNESAPFNPVSPYSVNKVYAFWAVKNYRVVYSMFACSGIMFNHESTRRTEAYVTRKITAAAARIRCGLQDCVYLGNLNIARDWGHAREYVHGIWKMLQQESPQDYVLATGIATTLRDFVSKAFAFAGMPLAWEGSGLEEIAVATEGPRAGQVVLRISPEFYRPSELDIVIGDSTKAQKELGWDPHNTTIDQLVSEMVSYDLELAMKECKRLGKTPEPLLPSTPSVPEP